MAKRKSRRIKKIIDPKLPKYSESNPIHPPLIIRDQTGALKLEDTLRLNMPIPEPVPADIEQAVNIFSMSLFGLRLDDVHFKWPYDYDAGASEIIFDDSYRRRRETERRFKEFENRFKTSKMNDITAASYLLRLGVNFMDEQHRPLLCTRFLCRQAEAVARGYAGRLPDRNAIELDRWAKNLESDATTFVSSKRKAARS